MAYIIEPIYETLENDPAELEEAIRKLINDHITFSEYTIPPDKANEQDGSVGVTPTEDLPKRKPKIFIGGMPEIRVQDLCPAISIRRFQEEITDEKNIIRIKIMAFIYNRNVEEGYKQLMDISQKIIDIIIKTGKYEVLRPVYEALDHITDHDENGAPIVKIDHLEYKTVYSIDKTTQSYVRRQIDAEQRFPYIVAELYFTFNGENIDREDGQEFLDGDDFLFAPIRSDGDVRDETGEIMTPDYEP